jgi:hypothetical protein
MSHSSACSTPSGEPGGISLNAHVGDELEFRVERSLEVRPILLRPSCERFRQGSPRSRRPVLVSTCSSSRIWRYCSRVPSDGGFAAMAPKGAAVLGSAWLWISADRGPCPPKQTSVPPNTSRNNGKVVATAGAPEGNCSWLVLLFVHHLVSTTPQMKTWMLAR